MLSRRALLGAGLVAAGGAMHRLSGADHRETAVDVGDHGAAVDQTPEHNLAAFRSAIADTPAGGTLLIPDNGAGTYAIDTSGGLTQALVIDRPMTVLLNGRIRATHGASGRNPPYIFDVRAADVRFAGHGTISGPGVADDTNNPNDICHAGLIRVSGDRFHFVGLTVKDVPKIGIHLWNCRGATISARWRGGIANYTHGHTALFGIRATGGGAHRIVSNRFERDEEGRRLITGYFAGGLMGATKGDEIVGNTADVHEKLAYLYTSFSRIADCHVIDALSTDILRIVGSHNEVVNITADRVKGGVTVYNGAHNTIRNCTFRNVYQAGIVVSFMAQYRDGHAGTIVTGNTIVAAPDATELQDGICLYLGDGDTSGMAVTNNSIEAAGASSWRNGIRVEAIPPFFAARLEVSGNIVRDSVNGLSLRRLSEGRVYRNRTARLRGGKTVLWITS